jgi:hypothetical protein
MGNERNKVFLIRSLIRLMQGEALLSNLDEDK